MRLQAILTVVGSALHLASAAPVFQQQQVVGMPAQGYHLLDLEPGSEPVWRTEEEKMDLLRSGAHFFDVTEVYDANQPWPLVMNNEAQTAAFPVPSHSSEITPLLKTLSITNMQDLLANLTSFHNRYFRSATGKAASQYIFDTIAQLATDRDDITVNKYNHSWSQFSVIAHIQGTSSGPLVILGTHEDSINLRNPSSGRAPGADDDGSGTVNLIEIFRALVAADFKPATPVEFHWYSGEEAGLLGSQAVAKDYKSKDIQVKAMLELDMTAYFAPGTKEVIALEADYIDSAETEFLKQLVDTYSTLDWAMDYACGYACSDHASWHKNGYTTGMLYEAITGDDNPNTHGVGDLTTVDGFSWSHSLEFAKVAIAFVYELSI